MPIYVVHYTYSDRAEEVRAAKPAHRAFLKSLVDGGSLVSSGPCVDTTPDQAYLIFRANSADAVAAFLADDPIKPLVTGRQITQWNPTLGVFSER